MADGRIFVQFGCGWSAPRGWVNYDASPTLRFERLPLIGRLYTKNASRFPDDVLLGDIVEGLPHPPGSVDGIYASHVLEHLSEQDCRQALRNVFALLKPGGTFRLIVPDLEWRARSYLDAAARGDADAAHAFMHSSFLGAQQRSRTLLGRLKDMLGNSAHLWMWDRRSMSHALEEAGFDRIRVCAFGDAADPEFALAEEPGRFIDDGHPEVALEARKPG